MDLSQHLRAIVSQRLVQGLDKERVPAVEVMLNSPYISELIEDAKIDQIKNAMEQASLDGMQTFDQSLYELFKNKKISIDNALHYAD